MDYQSSWSTRALNDLRSIIRYVNGENPFATGRVRQRIFKRVTLLESSPRLGTLFKLTSEGEIREITAGSYRIFYMPLDDTRTIRILKIQHVKWADPEFPE